MSKNRLYIFNPTPLYQDTKNCRILDRSATNDNLPNLEFCNRNLNGAHCKIPTTSELNQIFICSCQNTSFDDRIRFARMFFYWVKTGGGQFSVHVDKVLKFSLISAHTIS